MLSILKKKVKNSFKGKKIVFNKIFFYKLMTREEIFSSVEFLNGDFFVPHVAEYRRDL